MKKAPRLLFQKPKYRELHLSVLDGFNEMKSFKRKHRESQPLLPSIIFGVLFVSAQFHLRLPTNKIENDFLNKKQTILMFAEQVFKGNGI